MEPEPVTPEVEPTVVDVEQFREGNGILHCVNRLQADNPEIFKDMTPEEIHDWRIGQLKELGFKFKGGKWGYPNMPMWNEGSDTSFGGVQLIDGPDGPSIQLVQTDGANMRLGNR